MISSRASRKARSSASSTAASASLAAAASGRSTVPMSSIALRHAWQQRGCRASSHGKQKSLKYTTPAGLRSSSHTDANRSARRSASSLTPELG
eukprot:4901234-Pleurochrysis_carterae.AAC.1